MADLGAGGPESGAGPRYDACVAALKQWRDALVREGKLPLGGIKDTDLHRAITRGRREEKWVSSVLPATYRRFSADIVAIIMLADGEVLKQQQAPPPPPPPPAPVSPPTPPRPAIPMPAAQPAPAPTPGPSTSFGELIDPGPAPAPPPAPVPPSPERQAQLARIAAQFTPMDFSEEVGSPGPIKATVNPGAVTLSWEAAGKEGGGTVYRVVSSDDYAGYAPEFAELIDISQDLSAVDTREFMSAVRFYQVWRNSGTTPAAAMASQPRLHAQSIVVVPIQQLNLQEDGGRVIGQWSVFPGVTRVHVYRIPVERAAQAGNDPQYEIETTATNLSGFVDRGAVRGKKYLYRFYAEATIEGVARLSAAVGQVRSVSAVLNPVEDLDVQSHGSARDQQFDLMWTDPDAGRVVIYRTPSGPTAGLENETRDEATLEAFGLRMDLRLRHPTQRNADGTTAMADVPSPEDWERVYFTPVTLIDGKARVGRTVSKVVIGEVEHPVVVERTDHQVVKFGWPGEAAAVAVTIGPPGKEATVPTEGASYSEISRDHYRRLGGLQFAHRLPMDGCSVHLAGISFVGGARIYGAPAVTNYPGLLRLSYTVEFKRSFVHNPNYAIIRVWAERELNGSPPFVLVHHPERLPLFVEDGESLPVTLDVDEVSEPLRQFVPPRLGTSPGSTAYRASVRGRAGFVRLFVDVPLEMLRKVALIDPPVASLMPKG